MFQVLAHPTTAILAYDIGAASLVAFFLEDATPIPVTLAAVRAEPVNLYPAPEPEAEGEAPRRAAPRAVVSYAGGTETALRL